MNGEKRTVARQACDAIGLAIVARSLCAAFGPRIAFSKTMRDYSDEECLALVQQIARLLVKEARETTSLVEEHMSVADESTAIGMHEVLDILGTAVKRLDDTIAMLARDCREPPAN